LLTGHKGPSISNNTFMSFFKDPKKKKQAIQARQTLRDIQQAATLPLKFYLSHIQKGLSFWKVNDFIALFNVQKRKREIKSMNRFLKIFVCNISWMLFVIVC